MSKLNTLEGHLWKGDKIIRSPFNQSFTCITNTIELRSTLRHGNVAWPGFHDLAFNTSDGATLCFECVRENYALVSDSIRNEIDDGWRVDLCGIVHSVDDVGPCICDHCDEQLNSEV